MKLPLRIAFRYLFSIRRFHFITFITVISAIGIIIGVAALIIVISIFNGFGKFTEDQLIGIDPHIRIEPAEGVWLKDYEKTISEIKKIKEVKAVAPVIHQRAIITTKDNIKVVQLFGFDEHNFSTVSGLDQEIINGKFKLSDTQAGKSIVLGAGLAYALRVNVDSKVQIMTFRQIESSILAMSRRPGMEMTVTGVFSSNNPEYDDTYGITSLENASLLLNASKSAVTNIDIRLYNVDHSEKIKERIVKMFPMYSVSTWYDLHRELYTILKMERMAVFVVLSLIIIIAVFNILASLSMTVVEKRPDIAVLKALGANDTFIRKTFFYLGSLIGLISTTIGTVIGLALCYGQINYQWFKINSVQYLLDAIPVEVIWSDVVLVAVVSLAFSFIATVYPAKRAAAVPLIEAIREE